MIVILIALGGAIGSVSRYGVGLLAQRVTSVAFPIGTLTVNVVGSVLVGVLARKFMHVQTHAELRAMLIIGFCGGFTTFSAFSLEVLGLAQGGEWAKAAGYVMASVMLGIVGVALGFGLSSN
jgi:CrcB protein